MIVIYIFAIVIGSPLFDSVRLLLDAFAGTADLRLARLGIIGSTMCAHRNKGPRIRDAHRRHANGYCCGADRGSLRRPDAAMFGALAAISFSATVSGLAQFQGRQGRRHLHRACCLDCSGLGGRVLVLWLATAARPPRVYSSLSALVASCIRLIFLWWFGHPPSPRCSRADACCVLLRHRENNQAAAGRDGGKLVERTAFC